MFHKLQPQIPILASADVSCEPASRVKQGTTHHDNGGNIRIGGDELFAGAAVWQGAMIFEKKAQIFLTVPIIIIGKYEVGFWFFPEQFQLPGQLFRQPDIVVIEKRDVFAPGTMNAKVTRGGNPLMGLLQ